MSIVEDIPPAGKREFYTEGMAKDYDYRDPEAMAQDWARLAAEMRGVMQRWADGITEGFRPLVEAASRMRVELPAVVVSDRTPEA